MSIRYTVQFAHNANSRNHTTVEHIVDGTPIIVPAAWSADAARILSTLYARKAVPFLREDRPGYEHLPPSLRPQVALPGAPLERENDYRQILGRIATGLAFGAIEHGILDPESALAFRDDLQYLMEEQKLALNSPQWFNGGIWHAYGLEGSDVGLWALNPGTGEIEASRSTYRAPQLAACFILSLTDSLTGEHGISDWISTESRIFRSGSGAGTNIGVLRGKGELLSAGGSSSGMLSFAKVADANAGAIKSGGTTRRAAKMLCAPHDHPDVVDFITLKAREEQKVAALVAGAAILRDSPASNAVTDRVASDLETLRQSGVNLDLEPLTTDYTSEAYATVTGQNANNTVRWTDAFFDALDRGDSIPLRSVNDGSNVGSIPATSLWKTAAGATWFVGDPGYQFSDTINAWHTTPSFGTINASNPCGEYLSNDDSSCNLGTINVLRFLNGATMNDFDYPAFRNACTTLALALDITVSVSGYPTKAIAQNTLALRNLGANLTNVGALLMVLGLPYDDPMARNLAAGLCSLQTGETYGLSAKLAARFGACPAFAPNQSTALNVLEMHATAAGIDATYVKPTTPLPAHTIPLPLTALPVEFGLSLLDSWDSAIYAARKHGLRNMQATVAAPTGSVSFVLDADTFGIEPDYALAKKKYLADGKTLTYTNQTVSRVLTNLGYSESAIHQIAGHIAEYGTALSAPQLQSNHEPIFRTASGTNAISATGHIDMIAALQPHISGGISKSVNLPHSVTIEDIATYARYAYDHGVKGLTFYRDGSKLHQPLVNNAAVSIACPNCKTDNIVPTGSCAICTNCQKQLGGC